MSVINSPDAVTVQDLATAPGSVITTASPSPSSSTQLSFFSYLVSLLLWPIGKGSLLLLHFTIIKLPRFCLQLLSTSFSITLSFTTILIIFGIFFIISFLLVRYKLLTSYSKSREKSAPPNISTNSLLGNGEGGKRRFPGSYIDEFLIAIKIFGYLEKPVFNELTKQMKTQKLASDEFLYMDEHLGFAIVVEGNVQIFTKIGLSSDTDTGIDLSNDDETLKSETLIINGEKYQLLNEVKAGNPLSSLVNILSLFTDEDELPIISGTSSPDFQKTFPTTQLNGRLARNSFNNDIAPLDLNNPHSTNIDSSIPSTSQPLNPQQTNPQQTPLSPQPLTPPIIARATKDSTIAIIPAAAFQRLRKKHPRSSSHIVQMILTRLYRVTFQTAHNYLGLTKEIFASEVNLNNHVHSLHSSHSDMNWVDCMGSSKKDNVVDTVRRTATPIKKSRSMEGSKKQGGSQSCPPTNRPKMRRAESNHIVLEKSLSDSNSNPGDLLSNVPLSSKASSSIRSTGLYSSSSILSSNEMLDALSDDETDDRSQWILQESQELELKTTVVEGMFTFLGINKDSLIPRKPSSNIQKTDTSTLNSPVGFGGFQTFSIVGNNVSVGGGPDSYSRQRTFSTSSALNSASMNPDDCLDESLSYSNAKDEFSEKIQILSVEPGEILVEQDTSSARDNGLFYVINGELEVIYRDGSKNFRAALSENKTTTTTSVGGGTTTSTKKKQAGGKVVKEHVVYTVKPGGVAGYLGSLIGSRSMVTVRSSSDKPCLVGFLSKSDLEKLCEKYFMIYLTIAKTLIRSLSPKLLKLDSALEWIQLDAAETLFKQDTNANGIYVVLNGRLRSIREEPHSKEIKILKEYGQGESFGEVEVLTAAKRSSSFIAVRDSELARIPRNLFEILALENPGIMIKLSRIVAETIKKEEMDKVTDNYYKISSTGMSNFPDLNKNYRTITVLPTTNGLPVMEFSNRLIQAFQDVDKSVIGLDQTMTLSHLGRYAFDKMFSLRQSGFFSDLEDKYQIVLYIADTTVNSAWTSTCIQQGDCILLLADAENGDPSTIGEYERLLLKCKTTARVELIMLHQEKYVEPGLVNNWLKNRVWVDSHHHIQFNQHRLTTNPTAGQAPTGKVLGKFQNNNLNIWANTLKERVEIFRSRYGGISSRHKSSSLIPHYKNDFMRLARILSGQAVGIVFGGGGARGFSHLGVLRALEENGIPIDLIGGTSIGSFIGGLYARDYDLVPIYGRAKKFAGRIGSVWRTLFDLTLPLTSYTTGHEFNRGLWKIFGDSRIEDFWIQYFCNTTNITNSCMEIHSSGYAWRFIRASMSLAGLLPPIAHNGSMLLDGGYIDNLPVDEMKRRGASVIFAIDVGSVDDRTPMNYGDSLSGAWCFWNRWNPFSKHPNIPTMSEIQMRLCYVASVNALERVKSTSGIIYLRPPVEDYATLDFGKFEEIYHVGSVYGHMVLKEFIDDKKLPEIAGMKINEKRIKAVQRRNSV